MGMFEALLKPYLTKNYNCSTECIRQTTNKHRRILDTLEPLISQHRIIIDKKVVKDDYELTNNLYTPEKALQYQLFYQLSRLQKGANTLRHDDRLDSLQMACAYWQKLLAKDQDLAFKQRKEDLFSAELDLHFGRKSENSWFKL